MVANHAAGWRGGGVNGCVRSFMLARQVGRIGVTA